MGAGELVDVGWNRVSHKKSGFGEIVFTNVACAAAANQEYNRSGSMALAVYYRVNLFLMTGAAVDATSGEASEPSPLAGSKCLCRWTPPTGPLTMNGSCPLHGHLMSLGF